MAMLTRPSAAAKMALAYITIGALLIVWTGISFAYLYRHPPQREFWYYFDTGLLLTGVTLLIIGLGLGRIGRAARKADLPPPEATPTVAQTDRVAAATSLPSPQNIQPGAAKASPAAQPVQAVPVTPPVAAGTPYTPRR
jgi:hypothetical protein